MTINLTIENANEDLLKAIKNIVKLTDAKIVTKKQKGGELRAALKELERGEVVSCRDFDDFKRAMMA